jgi:hypothetical protein
VVVGSDDSAWVTDNHYGRFFKVSGPGPSAIFGVPPKSIGAVSESTMGALIDELWQEVVVQKEEESGY